MGVSCGPVGLNKDPTFPKKGSDSHSVGGKMGWAKITALGSRSGISGVDHDFSKELAEDASDDHAGDAATTGVFRAKVGGVQACLRPKASGAGHFIGAKVPCSRGLQGPFSHSTS